MQPADPLLLSKAGWRYIPESHLRKLSSPGITEWVELAKKTRQTRVRIAEAGADG